MDSTYNFEGKISHLERAQAAQEKKIAELQKKMENFSILLDSLDRDVRRIKKDGHISSVHKL